MSVKNKLIILLAVAILGMTMVMVTSVTGRKYASSAFEGGNPGPGLLDQYPAIQATGKKLSAQKRRIIH